MSHEADLMRMLEPTVRPAGSPAPHQTPQKPIESQDFQSLLQEQNKQVNAESNLATTRPLKLSGHAQQRLQQNDITLSDAQLDALSNAADKAEAKGSKDALMLMERLGLIVNIPNRTVLTILSPDRMQDGVVTKIDSTVLVEDPASEAMNRLG